MTIRQCEGCGRYSECVGGVNASGWHGETIQCCRCTKTEDSCETCLDANLNRPLRTTCLLCGNSRATWNEFRYCYECPNCQVSMVL